MKVYLIEEVGDYYHGSHVMFTCYPTYEQARSVAEKFERDQQVCSHCDHKFKYLVHTCEMAETGRV